MKKLITNNIHEQIVEELRRVTINLEVSKQRLVKLQEDAARDAKKTKKTKATQSDSQGSGEE